MEFMKNDEVLDSVKNLVAYIQNSEKYQKYQQIKAKMQENEKVQTLVDEYKKVQQEIAKKTNKAKKEEVGLLKQQLERISEQLETIPIYVTYLEVQEELDTLFQQIRFFFEDYFDHTLNE